MQKFPLAAGHRPALLECLQPWCAHPPIEVRALVLALFPAAQSSPAFQVL